MQMPVGNGVFAIGDFKSNLCYKINYRLFKQVIKLKKYLRVHKIS